MIFKKISMMSPKQIAWILIQGPRIILYFMIILYVFVMLFLKEISLDYVRFFAGFAIVVLVSLIYFKNRSNRILENIISSQVNLTKYTETQFLLYKQARGSIFRKEYFEAYQIGHAQVSYLKGQFEESLKEFYSINFDKITWKHRKKYRHLVNYYLCLNAIALGETETAEEIISSLSGEQVARVHAIQVIATGAETSHFEVLSPKNKLESIIKTYYSARNEMNLGNRAEARILFHKISSENPELFYVQEAKKYLEELTND